MEILSIIILLMVCVIAIAFRKDLKEMAARRPKQKKNEAKPAVAKTPTVVEDPAGGP